MGGLNTRSLGLDIGDRRIGVALSDPDGILASPLTIIERRDEAQDLANISEIAGKYQVGRIVAGLPRSMDGSLGSQASKVQTLVQGLRRHTEIPVELRDERLTTVAAKRLLHDAGGGKKRAKVRDDAAAAAVILQGYLDEGR